MTTFMIGLLIALAGYLGMRLHASASENASLRAHVASLKRQLRQR
jgi:hypothetical protein